MTKPKNELLSKAVEAAKTSTFDKTKASFTFDKKLFGEFQSFCKAQDVPQSRMLEELIRALLQDTKSPTYALDAGKTSDLIYSNGVS